MYCGPLSQLARRRVGSGLSVHIRQCHLAAVVRLRWLHAHYPVCFRLLMVADAMMDIELQSLPLALEEQSHTSVWLPCFFWAEVLQMQVLQ